MKKDYGLNELKIGSLYTSVIPTGQYVGCSCLVIPVASTSKINTTPVEIFSNKELTDLIDYDFMHCTHILFESRDDITRHSEMVWSFVKYYHKKGQKDCVFHIITDGTKWEPKFLYELDNIIINIKAPSTKDETPTEFIAWCVEDPYLVDRVEFRIIVAKIAQDITFARTEIPKLATFRRPITIQPVYWNEAEIKENMEIAQIHKNDTVYQKEVILPTGWRSYNQFAQEFAGMLRYPQARILPDLQRLYQISKFDKR